MADGDIKDTLGVTTKWFNLQASGTLVIVIILAILLNGVNSWLLMEQTKQLSTEHDELKKELNGWLEIIDCRLNLDIFINTTEEKTLSWYKMPKELRPCLPQYLMDRENGQQQKPRAKE